MFVMSAVRRPAACARSLDRLLDDRFFDRLVQPAGPEATAPAATKIATKTAATTAATTPGLDVRETDTAYTAHLDMPGVDKADVKITIDGRRISLEATPAPAATAPAEGDRALYTERAPARYARSFALPAEVDQAASTATMVNGVLTLSLAKRGIGQAASLTVN